MGQQSQRISRALAAALLGAAIIGLICLRSAALAVDGTSLQELIDATPAGGVIKLEPGKYTGNFFIKHSLTLEGGGKAIIDAGGTGTAITIANAADVTLSGLTIQNSGDNLGTEDAAVKADDSPRVKVLNTAIRETLFGIELHASPDSEVRDVSIRGFNLDSGRRGDAIKVWYSDRAKLSRLDIDRSRDVLLWYSTGTEIRDSRITGSRYGVHYMYSNVGLAERNRITGNSVGIYVMYSHDISALRNDLIGNRGPSGFGLAFKDSDRFKAVGNRINENRVGLFVDNSPINPPGSDEERCLTEQNRIFKNDIAVSFAGTGRGTVFRRNDFLENWQQVSTRGESRSEAVWNENYWSDYIGVDPDRTGFGSVPYKTRNLVDSITDKHEAFRLFNFGPAILAIEFAARAIPWFSEDNSLKDERPAMAPWTAAQGVTDRPLFLLIAFVLGAGAILMRRTVRL